MSDTPDPADIAHFSYPRFVVGGIRRLQIDYRNVSLRLGWPDTETGLADLMRLIGALPELMESARGEMDIHNTMRNIDSEIEDLLGGNGPECKDEK